jgi:hypothetical protein
LRKPTRRWEDAVPRIAVHLLQEWNCSVAARKGDGWSKELGEAKARKQAESRYGNKMCEEEICILWDITQR